MLFCEPIYSEVIAQPISLLLHLPYLPLILWYINRNSHPEADIFMGFQLFLHIFTAYGHSINNEYNIIIQHVSNVLVMIVMHFFIQLTTTRPENHLKIYAFLLIVYYFAPFWLYVIVGPIIVISYFMNKNVGDRIPQPHRILLPLIFGCTIALVGLEKIWCETLLDIYPLPYHAVFDILFWQVVLNYADIICFYHLKDKNY